MIFNLLLNGKKNKINNKNIGYSYTNELQFNCQIVFMHFYNDLFKKN